MWKGEDEVVRERFKKNFTQLKKLTKTLLTKRNALEFLQPVFLRSTVDDSVLEDVPIDSMMVDRGLASRALLVKLFQLPRVATFVVHQTRVVVSLVEVLEDGREDLWLVVRQMDTLALLSRVHVLLR